MVNDENKVMPVFEQHDVCDILKEPEIKERLEELKERTNTTGLEYAFNVCSDGRVTGIIGGSKKRSVVAGINKECDHKIDITVHSHPQSGISYPSSGDFVADLANQIRIASCVYGFRDDTVTCYRTSDAFRYGYLGPLEESYIKQVRIYNEYNNITDPEERRLLAIEFNRERRRYRYLISKIKHDIIKDIQPSITSISEYSIKSWLNPKFGNLGDVWVKDCGKI